MRNLLPFILNLVLIALYEPLSEQGVIFIFLLSIGLGAVYWYGLYTISIDIQRSQKAISHLLTLPEVRLRTIWVIWTAMAVASVPFAILDSLISNITASILLFLCWLYSAGVVQQTWGFASLNPIRVHPFYYISSGGIFFILMLTWSNFTDNRLTQYLLAYFFLLLANRYGSWLFILKPRRASQNGNYEVALSYYDRFSHPLWYSFLHESKLRNLKGFLNLKMRNYAACRDAALDVLNLRTAFSSSHVARTNAIDLMGLYEESQGNVEAGVDYVKAALKLYPTCAAFYDHLLWICMSNDRFDDDIPETARTGVNLARKRRARTAKSLYFASQAWVMAKQGNREEARHAIDDAIYYVSGFASEAADFHYRAGRVYEVLEDVEKARENYRRAVELDPKSNIAEKAQRFLAQLA